MQRRSASRSSALRSRARAERSAGVKGVLNEISIKPRVSQSAVRSDIEAAMQRHAKADAQKISVTVHGADVTLSGNVRSWSERETARSSAWNAPGVRTVVDNLVVSY